ncbi:MAG TPA: hypothetical protein VF681_08070 [Abditibacteriaceae bacterium]|jgi:tRNA nucleotidyltransferase (CCA-adding enzyme)
MKDFELPPGPLLDKAQAIARVAQSKGGRALLVGGWVRDALLGQSPKDADLEVFGIQPDGLRKMLRAFGRVNCVGESFRVYKLAWHENEERLELDVSIPRRDVKTGEGHKGFEIEGDPNATFEDAARRRDFTVNAIGCDPLTDEILDPFGGRADLEKRVLRSVDARHFGEDSLRVLRAMQFAARFELEIEPDTVAICRATPLSDLPRERLWMEWEKLLMKAAKPSRGIIAARALEIISRLFPELDAHIDEAVLDRAATLREALQPNKRAALMLAALTFNGGEALAQTILDALGVFSNDGFDTRAATLALAKTSKARIDCTLSDGEMRRLALRCDPPLLLALLESMGRDVSELRAQMQQLGVENGPIAPLLLGRHVLELGLKPGPRVGEITRAVYEQQLDGDVTNLEEALAVARALVE